MNNNNNNNNNNKIIINAPTVRIPRHTHLLIKVSY